MKILKSKEEGSGDFSKEKWRYVVRMTKAEIENPYCSFRRYFKVERCHHDYDCCGCFTSAYPDDIVRISARRFKATVTFYRNV